METRPVTETGNWIFKVKRHMTSAAKTSLRMAFFLAISLPAQPGPTDDPQRIADEEAVRRQNYTILLHKKLEEAQAALKRKLKLF